MPTTEMLSPKEEPVSPLRVLVVDDSRAQRKILSLHLERWGYEVSEAVCAEDALSFCQTQSFDLVISDWMMPGMSGVDFCRIFRQMTRASYGYFILLTSKSEKAEVADGLEAGADDFLTKPVNPDELRARLRAGERIIRMQSELIEKNRLVGATLRTLQELYDSLDRDLVEARKLQQTLVRDRFRDVRFGTVSLLIRPSGHVGGDLAGSFLISDDHLALYSVDVSGHGVAAAMMTARLSGLLSGTAPDQNLALSFGKNGEKRGVPPHQVAERFNRLMIDELQVEQYFTLAYAEIDMSDGTFSLVQAGHPHPMILRKDGGVEVVGTGGFPIGLFSDATFEGIRGTLQPGDRLFLMSDGLTECPDQTGAEIGIAGLTGLLLKNADLPSPQLLEALIWDLSLLSGTSEFPDDVSGLIFDYRGRPMA